MLAAFDAWGRGARAVCAASSPAPGRTGRGSSSSATSSGLAPLFHRESADGFVAATEGKQVAAGAGIAREPDVESVEAMFFGRFDARGTMLRGVERFPRASTATVVEDGPASFRRYWDPEPLLETARLSLAEAREQLAPTSSARCTGV